MSTTITRLSDSATTQPVLVLEWQARSESETQVHALIGGGIAVTVIPAQPRAGTIPLLYATEADALAARALHQTGDTYTILDDDRTLIVNMQYVVLRVSEALETETRDFWQIDVDYQEVLP